MVVPICKTVKVDVNGESSICGSPSAPVIPPVVEELELRDIAYITGFSTLNDLTDEPIYWDTVFLNDLGGTFDTAGVDAIPYSWAAPENGIYKVLLFLKYQVPTFVPTGPNGFAVLLMYDNSTYDDELGLESSSEHSLTIPTGYGDTFYDQRCVVKYFKMQTGQKLLFEQRIQFDVSAGADPDVKVDNNTSIEIIKIAEYTP